MKFLPTLLTVGSWNIEGIFYKINGTYHSKLDEDSCKTLIEKFDILCLQETHCHQKEKFTIPEGYFSTPLCRNISGNNRYFGGMLLLIKKQYRKGIKINKSIDVDALEVTLLHNFFDLSESIKIIFTYASPFTSCYTTGRPENILEKLDTKLTNARSTTIIMGDLNGRTQLAEDFVRDSQDEHSPANQLYIPKDIALKRENSDNQAPDKQGKIILDLCKTHSMRILNGRLNGDLTGRFTRYPKHEREKPSVIDYALCGESLLSNISSFSVLPFTEISDHCCISTNIKLGAPQIVEEDHPFVRLNPNLPRLLFQREKKHIFQANIMLSDKFDSLLRSINKTSKTNQDVDMCITQLNQVILDAAVKTFSQKYNSTSRSKAKQKRKPKTKIWFTQECDKLRRALRKLSKDISKFPLTGED